jgi:salicylate hydroxylase
VTLSTGDVLTADVIIGADGPHSIVRQVVELEEVEGQWAGSNVYTGNVPIDEMNKDPLLRDVLSLGWALWMGAGRSVLGRSSSRRCANIPNIDY